MPQYDLAYDLSAFNWRNTTGSDNDYRLVKNGNALFWRRKNVLVNGDVVVDSYDTDTSAIFHRTITTAAPTYTTQATWNGATSGNGSATSMFAEYVGNGTGLTNNSMCANPTPASGSIPAHTNTSGQQIAGNWRIRFTPTTGTELVTATNNLYLSFSFSGLVDCFQIGTSSTDHSIMIAAFGTNAIHTAGTWTLEKQTPGPINQASWNVGVKGVSGNGEWDDLTTPQQDFNTLDDAGNNVPRGIWSDGTTMWVVDDTDDKLYAYNLSTKARDATKDFDTLIAAGNTSPIGIWGDSNTMWVSDLVDRKIYAYNMSDKARDATKDFDTLIAAGNTVPYGIWSDGTTMWVLDQSTDKIFAYNLATKARDATKDFNTLIAAGNTATTGVWSDGTTMWVSDAAAAIFAYNLSTKARDATKDFDTLIAAGNLDTFGLWSDGTTMWVSDPSDDKIYAYNLATKAQNVAIPAQNSFCYNGVSSGSIPTDTSGTWELQLLNNSGTMNNNKVTGSLTTDTANNCLLVGTLANNRTAWGSGVDLNTGGGNWILRKIA